MSKKVEYSKDVFTAYVQFSPNGKEYAYLCDDESLRGYDSLEVEVHGAKKRVAVSYMTHPGNISRHATNWISGCPINWPDGKKPVPEQKDETLNFMNKGDTPMKSFNYNNFADRFFKKVDNVVIDLQTGSVGIQKNDSVYTFEKEEDGEFVINENMFAMLSMPIPAFAQATPLEAIKEGDLVARDNTVGWVTKVNKKTVTIMKPDGGTFNFSPPKNTVMGEVQNIMVIRNMMGDKEGLAGMQGMLMPMMMMGGDNADIEAMMPMMMMSQSGMMGGGEGGGGNMMQMMMMMQMMKK